MEAFRRRSVFIATRFAMSSAREARRIISRSSCSCMRETATVRLLRSNGLSTGAEGCSWPTAHTRTGAVTRPTHTESSTPSAVRVCTRRTLTTSSPGGAGCGCAGEMPSVVVMAVTASPSRTSPNRGDLSRGPSVTSWPTSVPAPGWAVRREWSCSRPRFRPWATSGPPGRPFSATPGTSSSLSGSSSASGRASNTPSPQVRRKAEASRPVREVPMRRARLPRRARRLPRVAAACCLFFLPEPSPSALSRVMVTARRPMPGSGSARGCSCMCSKREIGTTSSSDRGSSRFEVREEKDWPRSEALDDWRWELATPAAPATDAAAAAAPAGAPIPWPNPPAPFADATASPEDDAGRIFTEHSAGASSVDGSHAALTFPAPTPPPRPKPTPMPPAAAEPSASRAQGTGVGHTESNSSGKPLGERLVRGRRRALRGLRSVGTHASVRAESGSDTVWWALRVPDARFMAVLTVARWPCRRAARRATARARRVASSVAARGTNTSGARAASGCADAARRSPVEGGRIPSASAVARGRGGSGS
mmetsp:Transcript_11854/g.46297  ORF Transcript_11854/g.46297 Transcript_11854/m.46297 type:complete len:536 (+) Transcript_11854:1471-3078(+)